MKKEIKICLPIYKIVYSLAFVIILSLVRGVIYTEEIGAVIDPAIALLSIVFCADTYEMERHGKRWEIFALYPVINKTKLIFRRLIIQIVYLVCMSGIGYGMYYFQKTKRISQETDIVLFAYFLTAVLATIIFWSIFVMTIANTFRNIWIGIGTAIFTWVLLNSQYGERILGELNIFAYSFRKFDEVGDLSWILGKVIFIFGGIVMAGMIPFILKKRS